MASNYLEFCFKVNPPQPASEILIAELGYAGFESFLENEDGITAYIPLEEYDEETFAGIHILQSEEFNISYSSNEIEQVNWNEVWEKNFQPIVVGNKCSIRAPFHPKPDTEFDIIIEPKMSFGTGHHATTHMMLNYILKEDWFGKKVADMGCGTGVLAILAALKGAKNIDAIDIDNWCYQNTLENIARNDCDHIQVEEGGVEMIEGNTYDVILANINRNILLRDISGYFKSLEKGGKLFLSGFYKKDLEAIKEACEKLGMQFAGNLEREKWIAAQFLK